MFIIISKVALILKERGIQNKLIKVSLALNKLRYLIDIISKNFLEFITALVYGIYSSQSEEFKIL